MQLISLKQFVHGEQVILQSVTIIEQHDQLDNSLYSCKGGTKISITCIPIGNAEVDVQRFLHFTTS